MPADTPLSRRRALKTLFCSSAALALNVRREAKAQVEVSPESLQFLAIGDYGTGGADQRRVAAAMKGFVEKNAIRPNGLLMVGDNFYSEDKEGFSTESSRWKNQIEDMYPPDAFACPMWPVLGNHDYHDNYKGEKVQLAYAQKPGVRWTMPGKWFRVDLGSQPLVTFLFLDSNYRSVSGGFKRPSFSTGFRFRSLKEDEEEEQLEWFKAELEKPRAPFTVVVSHHPLYSNGEHGDSRTLIKEWGGLLQKHQVHAYICGHDHDMQHLEIEGKFTSFVLSGGGGAKTRGPTDNRNVPFYKETYGFSHLSVTPEALKISHYDDFGNPLHGFQKNLDGSVVLPT